MWTWVVIIVLAVIAIMVFYYIYVVPSNKKKAKHILKLGRIDNLKEFNRICDTLSREARDDLECGELWKKLQALKEIQDN